MNILDFIRETWRGKDMYRILMNEVCREYTLRGTTVDVGSATTLASYHRFLRREGEVKVECLDLGFESASTAGRKIDLETDPLPYGNEVVDTVLMFNLLEHIYHYRQPLIESKRILRLDGALIGAVPFLVNYHPDPHDYWRYTREALLKILSDDLGFREVRVTAFGRGPLTAAWSHAEQVVPRVLKIIAVPLVLGGDYLIQKVRPRMDRERFVLGYLFLGKK